MFVVAIDGFISAQSSETLLEIFSHPKEAPPPPSPEFDGGDPPQTKEGPLCCFHELWSAGQLAGQARSEMISTVLAHAVHASTLFVAAYPWPAELSL